MISRIYFFVQPSEKSVSKLVEPKVHSAAPSCSSTVHGTIENEEPITVKFNSNSLIQSDKCGEEYCWDLDE